MLLLLLLLLLWWWWWLNVFFLFYAFLLLNFSLKRSYKKNEDFQDSKLLALPISKCTIFYCVCTFVFVSIFVRRLFSTVCSRNIGSSLVYRFHFGRNDESKNEKNANEICVHLFLSPFVLFPHYIIVYRVITDAAKHQSL